MENANITVAEIDGYTVEIENSEHPSAYVFKDGFHASVANMMFFGGLNKGNEFVRVPFKSRKAIFLWALKNRY